MPGMSHGGQGRLPLVERVLELLRAGLSPQDFDAAEWQAQWAADQRRPPAPPPPRPRRRRRHEAKRPQGRKRPQEQSGSTANGERANGERKGIDPVLARCYESLQVSYGAGLAEIRAAWKQLVRKHHPDRHEQDPDRQLFEMEAIKEVNSSYEELKRRLK